MELRGAPAIQPSSHTAVMNSLRAPLLVPLVGVWRGLEVGRERGNRTAPAASSDSPHAALEVLPHPGFVYSESVRVTGRQRLATKQGCACMLSVSGCWNSPTPPSFFGTLCERSYCGGAVGIQRTQPPHRIVGPSPGLLGRAKLPVQK